MVDDVSLGLLLPSSSPSGSGCLSLEGGGLQLANSVLSFVLCAVLVVSYVRAFLVVAIPQSGLLAHSLRLPSGHSGLVLTLSNAAGASLPSPCLLVVGVGVCAASPLGELLLGMYSVGFNYLFIFPPGYVALCGSKARHILGSESVSWCSETSLRLPSQGGAPSLPLCLSFYLFYFFLPPLEDNGLLFWVPDVLCWHSEVVLWNFLSVQMFF